MGLFDFLGGKHHHAAAAQADVAQAPEQHADSSAIDHAGDAAVSRIASDEGAHAAVDGALEQQVCGIRIVAPAGVKAGALDKCGDYVRAEIGSNAYAQKQLAHKKTTLVIIPANTQMTDVSSFSSLRGKETPDGRHWEKVRGSGGMQLPNGTFALAVPEENLLHVQSVFQGYGTGYSVGMHELAHTVNNAAMTKQQQQRVVQLYAARKEMMQARGSFEGIFTDAYASEDRDEYFAQSTNCFFGKNANEGVNDRGWLQTNDPNMYAFLVELYDHAFDAHGEDLGMKDANSKNNDAGSNSRSDTQLA